MCSPDARRRSERAAPGRFKQAVAHRTESRWEPRTGGNQDDSLLADAMEPSRFHSGMVVLPRVRLDRPAAKGLLLALSILVATSCTRSAEVPAAQISHMRPGQSRTPDEELALQAARHAFFAEWHSGSRSDSRVFWFDAQESRAPDFCKPVGSQMDCYWLGVGTGFLFRLVRSDIGEWKVAWTGRQACKPMGAAAWSCIVIWIGPGPPFPGEPPGEPAPPPPLINPERAQPTPW